VKLTPELRPRCGGWPILDAKPDSGTAGGSNMFMTLAWYGHRFKRVPLAGVILVSCRSPVPILPGATSLTLRIRHVAAMFRQGTPPQS
jgi:hypothetical protein